ncbi:integrase catalytic domain-containing protein [Trichonephila clavipes]|nr:integrase catalytic domain-containing protein [Trichonephila clavipes]
MIWDRHCNTLSLNIPDLKGLMEEVITKRNILAASHKVFDPLGITGPVLLLPKLWLQSLWKSQIGWDQEVDTKTSQDFLKWLKELEYLKHVQVPRWLHWDSGFQHISLHFFCDASKLAYSAVVFLRVDIGSTVHIQLVQSKTRISPCGKKETTIARLELLGAAISARLSTTVLKEFPTDNVYFWTDSTTKLTPVKAWRHVPGSLNPEDCPNRGCSAKQLCSSKWWEGPSWLHLLPQEWPMSDVEDFKFLILLPANDVVAKLFREEHVKAMRAGSSILRARLKEKFWIIRAKRLVKQVLSECVICKSYKAKHVEVPFAPLPRDRVTQTKVFEVTGVDYAGSFYLKSKAKAWIVLFTCAVYRAVHFELVQSLTTNTFIQALRRFIARRGRISILYSDNFVGTNDALRTLD